MIVTVERLIKFGTGLIAALLLILAVPTASFAAGTAQVVQQHVTNDSVVVYVKGTDYSGLTSATIGQEPVPDAHVDWDPIRVVTWLLYDNSYSMPAADRTTAKSWLREFVSNHAPNEIFCLATYSNRLDVSLVRDSQQYIELANQIDAIQARDQDSFLMNAIGEILDEEGRRSEKAYVRIVVISDGGDSGAHGTTLDALRTRLAQSNIPIYTIGCGNDNQARKDMTTLSLDSKAKSWDLNASDARSVSQELRYGEMPSRVIVPVPANLQDGNMRGIQLSFENGDTVSTQVQMRFGTPQPEPTPDPDPVPAPEPEVEPSSFPWGTVLIVILLLLLIAGGVFLFLYLRKRRETETIRPVGGQKQGAEGGGERTDILSDSQESDSEYTVPLVNDDSHLMLSLVDVNNPDNYFESPLRGRVTIGRNSSNQIIIAYDRSVSGHHCEIYIDRNNDFKIHDLNSSNGTFIEGDRVADTAEIANGSVIRLGRLELRVGIR